jgi:hypothetical protein
VRPKPHQISEILFRDRNLNEVFIDIIEKIHMKQRLMGVRFSLKSREVKNRYINSQMKDGLYELDVDLANYGKDNAEIVIVPLEEGTTVALDQIKTSLDITLAPAQPQTTAGLLHVFQDIYWIPNMHQELIHHLGERRMVVAIIENSELVNRTSHYCYPNTQRTKYTNFHLDRKWYFPTLI